MAVSIEELISKKEEIQKSKEQEFDLDTSIGVITVKIPSRTMFVEANGLSEAGEPDKYLVYHAVVEPDLTSKKLQEAFNCGEPIDIVDKLFLPGEAQAIVKKIMDLAGYGTDIKSKVHEEIKN